MVAVRLAMWAVVAAIAWQVKGDRGEVVRDLLMHPRARACMRAELDVLCVVPRLLLMRPRSPGMAYHRGAYGAAIAFAFTPAVAADCVVFHLIVGGGRLAWAISALHVYSLIWLWGYALGARAFPIASGPERRSSATARGTACACRRTPSRRRPRIASA